MQEATAVVVDTAVGLAAAGSPDGAVAVALGIAAGVVICGITAAPGRDGPAMTRPEPTKLTRPAPREAPVDADAPVAIEVVPSLAMVAVAVAV
uniref:hypothetical protein n=1 Tax=Frankia gtarii TaxID=2950102 RepID=UPI0021C126A3